MHIPFSSGFGNFTVGNSGSGSCCSLTEIKGVNPKVSNAFVAQGWLTPCIDVLTNFTLVFAFRSLYWS
jgi:hypothetical protein